MVNNVLWNIQTSRAKVGIIHSLRLVLTCKYVSDLSSQLKSPHDSFNTFIAHYTSVSSLGFKPKGNKQQVAQVMSVNKSRSKSTSRTVMEETKEITELVSLEVEQHVL